MNQERMSAAEDEYDAAKDGHDSLSYDSETGVLSWKYRTDAAKDWNTRYAGKPVGYINAHGYRVFSFKGRVLYAHRVIWQLCIGVTECQIDHINGDRSDNRIVNLRAVGAQENRRNAARNTNNSSGVTGVSWNAARNRWRATITVDRQSIALGSFVSKADAISARSHAERTYGFHPNHGRAREDYNPREDGRKSYFAAVEAKRARGDTHDWEDRKPKPEASS